jgi:hypothetical protein
LEVDSFNFVEESVGKVHTYNMAVAIHTTRDIVSLSGTFLLHTHIREKINTQFVKMIS